MSAREDLVRELSLLATMPNPRDLAERFGQRAVEHIREGREAYYTARLAFSFAERVLDEREIRMALQ